MTGSTDEVRRIVYLGLGSNIGDREENLRAAVSKLAEIGEIECVAGLYATAPVGVTDQPEFRNSACALWTSLSLSDLLREVKQIEWELGRRHGQVWGPRPIDIDILLAGDESVARAGLTVPHLRLAERGFALAPLAEIAGAITHPLLMKLISVLLTDLLPEEMAGVSRLSGPEWTAAKA